MSLHRCISKETIDLAIQEAKEEAQGIQRLLVAEKENSRQARKAKLDKLVDEVLLHIPAIVKKGVLGHRDVVSIYNYPFFDVKRACFDSEKSLGPTRGNRLNEKQWQVEVNDHVDEVAAEVKRTLRGWGYEVFDLYCEWSNHEDTMNHYMETSLEMMLRIE